MRWGTLLLVAALMCSAACSRSKAKARGGPTGTERQQPVAVLAPILDGGPPLIEVKDGGATEARVDRAIVRGMLATKTVRRPHGVLHEAPGRVRDRPAQGAPRPRRGDSFDSAEPEIEPALDAWVSALPASFAPYLARGVHFHAVAFARRGAKWAKDTPAADMKAMSAPLDLSEADLDKALELRPKSIAAIRKKIMGGNATPPLVARALAICPTCYRVRVAIITNMTPRWGGSYAAMDAFAKKSAKVVPTAEMKLLTGFIDEDKASLLRIAGKPEDARAPIDRACALGDEWRSSSKERASITHGRISQPRASTSIAPPRCGRAIRKS